MIDFIGFDGRIFNGLSAEKFEICFQHGGSSQMYELSFIFLSHFFLPYFGVKNFPFKILKIFLEITYFSCGFV